MPLKRWLTYCGSTAVACAVVLMVGCAAARADEVTQREADIKAKLADMAVGSSMERALKADDALKARDPVLRSMAMEQALGDNDSRVREIALNAFISAHKTFVLQVDTPESELAKLDGKSTNHKSCLQSLNSANVEIRDVDPQSGHFTAELVRYDSPGVIDRAGLTLLTCFWPPYGKTRVVLRGVSDGYLIGTAVWGPLSLPAKVALQ